MTVGSEPSFFMDNRRQRHYKERVMPQDNQDDVYRAVAAALSRKVVHIGGNELQALLGLAERPEPLGMTVDKDITIPINNGTGTWNGSYPTLFVTVSGSVTIILPDNTDQWWINALDGNKTIYQGEAYHNVPVSVNYKTGLKIDLQISVSDKSNPSFSGSLTVHVSGSA
jgi:hypothetical protein